MTSSRALVRGGGFYSKAFSPSLLVPESPRVRPTTPLESSVQAPDIVRCERDCNGWKRPASIQQVVLAYVRGHFGSFWTRSIRWLHTIAGSGRRWVVQASMDFI